MDLMMSMLTVNPMERPTIEMVISRLEPIRDKHNNRL